MLFTGSVFLLWFLPLLVLCYFLIPRRFLPARNLALLVFSLAFYGFGGLRWLPLLCLCILVNYLGALLLSRRGPGAGRRLLLGLTLAVDLGLLIWFKYAGFAGEILVSLGLPVSVPAVVLPVGISFFTFQGMSYTIDVYRGEVPAEKNPLNVALYISFFPQLVAGPIVRYTTIAESIRAREHSLPEFAGGLTRFLFGFGKKMLLANVMGQAADAAFALTGHPSLTAALAWTGAAAYTFQIYFDFSGYSDMAIGLGRMFGFRFEENFRYPYVSGSVTEFWRRWHISLSGWFRDYVYIPLGGNRCSRGRHIFNLLLVWLLTGLWHGANWTFLLWGLYYGLLLLLEKYPLRRVLPRIPAPLRHLGTLLLVVLGWVLFRSESLPGALSYLKAMFGSRGFASGQALYYLREFAPEFLCCAAASLPLKPWLEKRCLGETASPALRTAARAGAMILGAAVFALGYTELVFGSFNPFIYFQF